VTNHRPYYRGYAARHHPYYHSTVQ
jgi:hypothetical protein